jgi:hypothetical protein
MGICCLKNSLLFLLAFTSALLVEPIIADSGLAQTEAEDDTMVAMAEFDILDGSGVLENVGDQINGIPMEPLSEGWLEDLIIAPVPGYSPQLGWMLSGMAGYFIDLDKQNPDTKPSVIGAFGMISENDSYMYGVGTYLHLFGDELRVKAGAGYGDINYRYYGTGNILNKTGISVQIRQKMPLYFVSTTYRVWNQFYMGVGFLGGNVETGVDVRYEGPPLFLDVTVDIDVAALEIPLQFDTRDHEQFPRNGWLINGRALLYRKDLGSDIDTETFMVNINNYIPMRERDALALRLYLRGTDDGAPFFLLSTFGGRTDLRGYESGRYRDRMMYATQAEYRWQPSDRWIYTGFAGFGEVAEQFSDMGENYLPATGVGVRFVISKKHNVGLAADVATGIEGTQFYFGVGQAY